MENNLKPLPKVEIDSLALFEIGLTPDLYLLLYWKKHSNEYELPGIIQMLHYPGYSLKHLEDNDYIKITGFNTFDLRDKALQLFSPDTFDQMFYELLSTFPMKVPSSNGTYRILRPKDPSANLNKDAKRKYFNIIKGKHNLHKIIIKSLHKELETRRNANSFTYMQNFITWLNQRTWEMYEGLEEEDSTTSESLLN